MRRQRNSQARKELVLRRQRVPVLAGEGYIGNPLRRLILRQTAARQQNQHRKNARDLPGLIRPKRPDETEQPIVARVCKNTIADSFPGGCHSAIVMLSAKAASILGCPP